MNVAKLEIMPYQANSVEWQNAADEINARIPIGRNGKIVYSQWNYTPTLKNISHKYPNLIIRVLHLEESETLVSYYHNNQWYYVDEPTDRLHGFDFKWLKESASNAYAAMMV